MGLQEYRAKRDFDRTAEPRGADRVTTQWPPRFVVQKHQASRLHYDVRLEIGGVLVSWAVPLGPSTRPADKRFAARTEDHPLEYRDFEGVIPEGEYGAGRMIVWDQGIFVPVPDRKGAQPEIDPQAGPEMLRRQLEAGAVKVEMLGEKLQGRWALVRMAPREGEQGGWLMIKDRDAHSTEEGGLPGDDTSVLTGRTVDEVAYPGAIHAPAADCRAALDGILGAGRDVTLALSGGTVRLTNLDKVYWPATADRPALTKRDFLAYYARMARPVLRHLHGRPLALTRYPDGIHGGSFYQKDSKPGTPDFVETVAIWSDHRAQRADGDIDFVLCHNLPTLLWLAQLGTIEIHPWISRIAPAGPGEAPFGTTFSGSREDLERSALNYPDFLLFDIDPYVYSGQEAPGTEPELHREGYERGKEGAFKVKEQLDALGLPSFVKTSGKTGLHIHAPVLRQYTFTECRAIVGTLVDQMAREQPDRFTVEWAVEKRRGRIFMDKNQNVRGKNMAGAYCTRPSAEATVSMPLTWEALATAYPTDFTILTVPEIVAAQGDAWLEILAKPTDLQAILGG